MYRLTELIEILWTELEDEFPEGDSVAHEELASRMASLVQDFVNI